MAIRRATSGDVDRVAPLFSRYREFYGQPPDPAAAASFLRDRVTREESHIFVAETTEGRAVGFAQVYPTFASIELAPGWRLSDLYVAEAARGTGVGALLLRAAADAARAAGAAWVDLETARTNTVAQRLYEREHYRRDDVYLHYTREL